jgi:hypothetical protein
MKSSSKHCFIDVFSLGANGGYVMSVNSDSGQKQLLNFTAMNNKDKQDSYVAG